MPRVYTIGYEDTDIERFVAVIGAVGVKRIADVRAVAISRKNGFSKKLLAARLEAEGVEYLHLIGLGNPKSGRDAARAGLDRQFRDIYELHLRSLDSLSSLKELVALAGEKTTCLLCFERDPKTCHRSIVGDRMRQCGFEVVDLFGNDPKCYAHNASRVPRRHSGEGAATA